jgi:hypothetical protein
MGPKRATHATRQGSRQGLRCNDRHSRGGAMGRCGCNSNSMAPVADPTSTSAPADCQRFTTSGFGNPHRLR